MSSATAREPFVPAGPYGLLVGGEELAPNGRFEAVDPSTGQPWAEVAQASPADVERAVAAAANAFGSWRRSTPGERREALWRLADAVESQPERWARLLATENGRPIREATIVDVPTCAGILRFFSGLSRDLRGDQVPVERAETLIYSRREPLGVIAALIPWNSPIITLANKVGPALAAGNTVVLKPSELASPSVVEFARLANEILPEGVLNVLTGFGPEVGAALVSHPEVAKITELPAPLDGGFFVSPTLLVDECGETSASREELFGPITVLERFEHEAEAVARANATRYGLAAGVWTENLGRAHRVAHQLDAGIVWVNKWFDLPVGMPMGGVKDSGFGRELSAETLHEYSAPKVVNVDLSSARPELWG